MTTVATRRDEPPCLLRPESPGGHRNLAIRLHLVATVSGVAFGLTAPLTVVYAVALGANALVAGAAVSSLAVTVLALDLFGTRFVPRLEPRSALTLALLIFGTGSVISAFTTNLAVMIGARCLQGLGVALFQGVGPQLAVQIAGPGNEGHALGRFQAAWFCGIALGPLAGGGIAQVVGGIDGLRAAFGACALASYFGALVVRLMLPARSTGLALEIGLPRLGAMLARRPLLALGVASSGQAIRSGIAMTLLPLVAQRQFGLGGLALGAALSVLAVSDVTSMYLGGYLGDRLGRIPILVCALGLGAVLALLAAQLESPWSFALICLGMGIPVGVGWVVPAAMVVDLASDAVSGLAAYRIAADVGLGAGGVLAGAIVAGLGTRGALIAVAGALVLPALLAVLVRETRPLHRPAAPVLAALFTTPPRPIEGSDTMPPNSNTKDASHYESLALDQGLRFSPERYAAALDTHAGMRAALLRLREVPLSFTDPTEPASALVWIENGGSSV